MAAVVIGGPDALIDAARRATESATAGRVITCDVAGAATKVAAIRPFAIVISEELYGFDSAEFEALARDVQSHLITLPTHGQSPRQLEQRLVPAMLGAFRKQFRE